jgi:hypothetical protein
MLRATGADALVLVVAIVDAKNCTRHHQQFFKFVIRLRPFGGDGAFVQ